MIFVVRWWVRSLLCYFWFHVYYSCLEISLFFTHTVVTVTSRTRIWCLFILRSYTSILCNCYLCMFNDKNYRDCLVAVLIRQNEMVVLLGIRSMVFRTMLNCVGSCTVFFASFNSLTKFASFNAAAGGWENYRDAITATFRDSWLVGFLKFKQVLWQRSFLFKLAILLTHKSFHLIAQ